MGILVHNEFEVVRLLGNQPIEGMDREDIRRTRCLSTINHQNWGLPHNLNTISAMGIDPTY